MALKSKVIDSKKLHLISCLTRAYGYKLRFKVGGEFGYELTIWGANKPGLAPDLLAGGMGYTEEEAIDNCFEDCKDQKKLLGTLTNPWIEFENEDDLDITLTLMGHHPSYEPVHMKPIDFDKWEVGPEDGAPIILVAPPDPNKKVDHRGFDNSGYQKDKSGLSGFDFEGMMSSMGLKGK